MIGEQISLTGASPSVVQRLAHVVGKFPIPKIETLYWKIGLLGKSEPKEFDICFEGLRYRGSLNQYIDRHIYFLGSYAPGELCFLNSAASVLRKTRRFLNFVDVGANVGQHSLFMSKRVDRVIAFEPNNDVAARLEMNAQRNDVRNILLLHYALGDVDGEGQLGSGFDDNSGARSLTWTLDPAKDIRVEVRRGDAVMDNLGVERIDILKLDVEGYEKKVLEGLAETLRRDRPVILFELVGQSMKGGFRSEQELRSALYPNHRLFSLNAKDGRLRDFDWSIEEAVCLPDELYASFKQ